MLKDAVCFYWFYSTFSWRSLHLLYMWSLWRAATVRNVISSKQNVPVLWASGIFSLVFSEDFRKNPEETCDISHTEQFTEAKDKPTAVSHEGRRHTGFQRRQILLLLRRFRCHVSYFSNKNMWFYHTGHMGSWSGIRGQNTNLKVIELNMKEKLKYRQYIYTYISIMYLLFF